jgi:hypothetical protein
MDIITEASELYRDLLHKKIIEIIDIYDEWYEYYTNIYYLSIFVIILSLILSFIFKLYTFILTTTLFLCVIITPYASITKNLQNSDDYIEEIVINPKRAAFYGFLYPSFINQFAKQVVYNKNYEWQNIILFLGFNDGKVEKNENKFVTDLMFIIKSLHRIPNLSTKTIYKSNNIVCKAR